MDIYTPFEPENIDPENLSFFFLKVIDTIMLPSMSHEDVIEETGFGYQLIYLTWLIYTGRLDEITKDGKKTLYLHPDAKEPNVEVLLNTTAYPSLICLIHEMKLYNHGIILFSQYEEHPTNFEESINFDFARSVDLDKVYWLNGFPNCNLFRMFQSPCNNIIASLITETSITYYSKLNTHNLYKEIEDAWDGSGQLDIGSIVDFKVMERLTSQIRSN